MRPAVSATKHNGGEWRTAARQTIGVTQEKVKRCFAADVRDRRSPHQSAGDDAVRLARALAYVLDTLEARRREGKSLLGLDETVRMLVDGLKARGAEFR
jgi:hypothetical protein